MSSYIIRKIDEDLWRRFKAAAAMRGESMREALLNAIRKYIVDAERGRKA